VILNSRTFAILVIRGTIGFSDRFVPAFVPRSAPRTSLVSTLGEMDWIAKEASATEAEAVPVEHLDYGYVDKCADAKELKTILDAVRSGVHGKYEDLERHVERRMLESMTPEQRSRYHALHSTPSLDEARAAKLDVNEWLRTVASTSAARTSAATRGDPILPPPRTSHAPGPAVTIPATASAAALKPASSTVVGAALTGTAAPTPVAAGGSSRTVPSASAARPAGE